MKKLEKVVEYTNSTVYCNGSQHVQTFKTNPQTTVFVENCRPNVCAARQRQVINTVNDLTRCFLLNHLRHTVSQAFPNTDVEIRNISNDGRMAVVYFNGTVGCVNTRIILNMCDEFHRRDNSAPKKAWRS